MRPASEALASPALAGLAAVGFGVALPTFDLAVNVAFPAITEAFALSTPGIRWVVACYVVTYAALMLGFGRLGDVVGHRRVFRWGVTTSLVAFVLCALAPDYGALLAARVLQGVGAALVLSCSPALVTSLVEEGRRTWALSVHATMAAGAGVLAPLLGGAAMAFLGWSGVFWFRLPFALAALALLALIRERRHAPAHGNRYDATAAALLAAGLASLLMAPVLLQSQELRPAVGVLAPAGLLLLFAFAARQGGGAAPLLPRGMRRIPGFIAANGASVAVHVAAFAVPLFVPYFLARVQGLPPVGIGVVLAASPLGIMAGSWSASRAVPLLGRRRSGLLAGAVLAATQAMIGSWDAQTGLFSCALLLAVHGAAIGLFQVAYADSVIEALPLQHRGVAGGMTVLTRTLGVMVGVVALTALMQFLEAEQAPSSNATQAFLAGFRDVFRYSAAGFAVAFATLSARRDVLR